MNRNGVRQASTVLAAVVAVTAASPTLTATASTGDFLPAQYISTGFTTTNTLAVADVTGDGRPDIVVGVGAADNTETSSLLVYAQQPDHRYGTPRRIVGHGDDRDVRLAVGDIDGDGRIDAALATSAGVDVFYQRSGQLTGPTLVGTGAEDVALSDVTGDERLDLIASAYQGTVLIYRQTPAGTFGTATSVTGPFESGAPWGQVFAADLNGDSRPDIAQFYGKGTWVRLQQPDGTFGPATTHLVAPDSDGYRWAGGGAAVGDLTGDGRTDLVMTTAANRPNSAVNVFAQQAGGLTTTPVAYPAYDLASGMAIGDLTGDGRSDLVVAHNSWLALTIAVQQAGGALGGYRINDADGIGSALDGLAIADLNADGKLDVVSVAYTKLVLLLQR
ncbi:FG-GAP repeat domain-containing protein [Micromonospora sp. NBC_01796]|uniref:FG-GAP repeat domain-containing protein n=1 Tax=Micromonospora sp. NBC_01796 TaxID=2975987 RepID=UPI002DDC7BB9|nr:VCBS repeat-containing protein [Micromonospora sp. NBC_01796]WSA85184.1 VCBS repeat-containing protein [Micromonospora sp. NBC_01796]